MDKKEKQGALVGVIIVIAVAAAIAYAVMSARPLAWQNDGPPLSSSGIQDIAPFTINSIQWRVAWMINQTDQMFVLAVYMQNSTGAYSWVTDTSPMTTNATQGFLPVYYTGTFVMRVVASNNTQWVLDIQEPKPA